MDQNEKKSSQLGMPNGTAANRLRKIVLFDVLKRHSENVCFKCGKSIDGPDELSIEHKTPWLDSDNPVEMFFDLNNIAFSHLSCNVLSRRTRSNGIGVGSSGYRGVCLDGRSTSKKPFISTACVNSNRIYIGRYSSARDAAVAYDTFMEKNLPEAITNKMLGLL